MDIFKGLMNNPKLIQLAFSKLAGVFEERHLEYIVLSLTEDGQSVKADFYEQGEIIITKMIELNGNNDDTAKGASEPATASSGAEPDSGGQSS